MSITNSNIYYINSANRITGTDANFSYQLPIPPGIDYDRVTVLQANIPMSYYLVQAGQNTFTLQELGNNYTVTVPPGNYSALSFITVITPILNSASGHGWTYAFTLPNQFTQPNTAKYTYTVTGSGSSQPSFIFGKYLYQQFGFSANSTNTFTSNTLTSANVLNFIPEQTLLIHSNICQNYNSTDILQEVYNNNNAPFSQITYLATAAEAYSKPFIKTTGGLFNIYITDENNLPIDLNGINCNFSLLLYEKDDSSERLKEYINWEYLRAEPPQPNPPPT